MDVLEAIRIRRSVREYSPKPIPDEVMRRMRQALRFAPSACNYQPCHFIFVMEAELRRKLAQVAKGQGWMADAPVTVVACAFAGQAFKRMGGHGNSADIDVTIAMDHLTLAAAAEGLGTCWIGAFDEAGAKELLHVPRAAKVVTMTPLGYPASPGLNHALDDADRKPPAEVFSMDRYGTPLHIA
ncbi:MAG: nitroreductase family protein [Phycisphaerae bacterium]|nr:nitroreductase family protein [Phycisphaerae bacterium]